MTVIESIKAWLKSNNLEIKEISTEMLPQGASQYSMMKSPQNQCERYIDGSERRTEFYTVFARREYQFKEDREQNDLFFENLEYKVSELDASSQLPELGNGRECEGIEISGSSYLFSTSENECVYSLTIKIIYRKG